MNMYYSIFCYQLVHHRTRLCSVRMLGTRIFLSTLFLKLLFFLFLVANWVLPIVLRNSTTVEGNQLVCGSKEPLCLAFSLRCSVVFKDESFPSCCSAVRPMHFLSPVFILLVERCAKRIETPVTRMSGPERHFLPQNSSGRDCISSLPCPITGKRLFQFTCLNRAVAGSGR